MTLPRSNAYSYMVHVRYARSGYATAEYDNREDALDSVAPYIARNFLTSVDDDGEDRPVEIALYCDGEQLHRWLRPTNEWLGFDLNNVVEGALCIA